MPPEQTSREYLALRAKVDEFCRAATESSQGALRCEAGCHGCCVAELSVSPVEAQMLSRALDALPSATRETLRARAHTDAGCMLLDAKGRCSVYASRPLVCRTQGLALAYPADLIPEEAIMGRDAQGRDVTYCPLNFTEQTPAADAVLDAERVDQLLALINRRFCEAHGLDPETREGLEALLMA